MATPLRILLSPDKFKGSLTAEGVCQSLSKGIKKHLPSAEIRNLPMADGGDGTLEILSNYLHLNRISVATVDPIGRPIVANYLVDKTRAFIEVASASGIVLLDKHEQNPLHTSTYGTGLMVLDAINKGKTEIYLLLGGSATNDMGLGIASALGVDVDVDGALKTAITGSDLHTIKSIRRSPQKTDLSNVRFTLFCDVTNPVYGPNGAAYVYARQKGASEDEIEELDQGLRNATSILQELTYVNLADLPGGGAAGGIGTGLVALFGAELQSGFEAVAKLTNLEEHLEWADSIITGEGQIDGQSLQGKVVGKLIDLCSQRNKPCHVVVGHSDFPKGQPLPKGIASLYTLTSVEPDVTVCMTEGERLVEEIGEAWAKANG